MTTFKAFHTVDDAFRRRSAVHFGLTDRALQFARLYAANPQLGATACATYAGYSNRGRAAHVRGCELLRDPRVIRAIVYFGSLALVEAQAMATKRLRLLADDGNALSRRDRSIIEKMAIDLARFSCLADRSLNRSVSHNGKRYAAGGFPTALR